MQIRALGGTLEGVVLCTLMLLRTMKFLLCIKMQIVVNLRLNQKWTQFLKTIWHNVHIHALYKPLIVLYIRLETTSLQYLAKTESVSYTSNKIVDEFLDCQAEVMQDKTVEKVKEGKVNGLLAVEFTNTCARKFLPCWPDKIAFLQNAQQTASSLPWRSSCLKWPLFS